MISNEWQQFFEITSLHESTQEGFVKFIGSWPKDVDPNQFSSANWLDIVSRIRDYIAMPYPVRTFRRGSEMSGGTPPGPAYNMIDGKMKRRSYPMLDSLLCMVIPAGESVIGEPPAIVLRLLERYSEWPLARLVFVLPRFHDASEAAKSGQAAVLVIEDMLVQIYMGVENLLFNVYDDLPEGGHLSDEAIELKLKSLLVPN